MNIFDPAAYVQARGEVNAVEEVVATSLDPVLSDEGTCT